MTLLEGLLSVGVIAAGLAIITTLQVNQFNFEKAAVAAQQHRIVHYAARRYVRDFFSTLLSATDRDGVTEIPQGLMAVEGYLPDFMVQNGVLRVNPYSQQYRVLVRRTDKDDEPPTLELLTMTTGGKPLTATEAGRVVSIAGAEAGTLSIDGQALSGAYGSWEIPLSELPRDYQPQRGNLAMIAYFRQGGGAYVNSYEVNLPSRLDQHEELPTTEDRITTSRGGGVDRLIGNHNRRQAERRNQRQNTAQRSEPEFTGSFGRSFNQDLFTTRERGQFSLEPEPVAPPRPTAQPAPAPQPARAPQPVQSDNTMASAGSPCAPNRSLAISLDNRNQVLVCQERSWQPINLPLALHYGGLNQNGAQVRSQSFPVNQRAFLVAQSAIGPARGEPRLSLPPGAGIQVNGNACRNSAPEPSSTDQPGQFRCAMVLEPGQYTISSYDGIGVGQRTFHRLSFVVLPY